MTFFPEPLRRRVRGHRHQLRPRTDGVRPVFVPEFRSTFSMSDTGVRASSRALASAGFFVGLLAAQVLLLRVGPAVPVLVGLAAATPGLGIVALAPASGCFAAGVAVAASSRRVRLDAVQRCRAPQDPRGGPPDRPVRDQHRHRDRGQPCRCDGPGHGPSRIRLALRLGRLRGGRARWRLPETGPPFAMWTRPPRPDPTRGGAIFPPLHRPAIPLLRARLRLRRHFGRLSLSFAADRFRAARRLAGLPGGATPGDSVHYLRSLRPPRACSPAGRATPSGCRGSCGYVPRLGASAGSLRAMRRCCRAAGFGLLPVGGGLQGRQRDDERSAVSRLFWFGNGCVPALPSFGFTGGALLATAAGKPSSGPALAGAGLGYGGGTGDVPRHRRDPRLQPAALGAGALRGGSTPNIAHRPHIGGRARDPIRKKGKPPPPIWGCPCPFPRPVRGVRSFVFPGASTAEPSGSSLLISFSVTSRQFDDEVDDLVLETAARGSAACAARLDWIELEERAFLPAIYWRALHHDRLPSSPASRPFDLVLLAQVGPSQQGPSFTRRTASFWCSSVGVISGWSWP